MIILKNSIYYDIPKTAGSWISEGLTRYKVGKFEVGTSHNPPDPKDKQFHGKKLSFTFIRHPVDWYKSYFTSRVDKSKEMAGDFYNFLIRMYDGGLDIDGVKVLPCVTHWTNLTDYYQKFLVCDAVGRMEDLPGSLKHILTTFGEECPVELLQRPKVNTSTYHFDVDPQSRKLIEEKESWIIDNFYGK